MKNENKYIELDRPALRRKVLLGLSGGVAGLSQLPTKWVTPVVDSIILPAHAQTSATTTTTPPVTTTPSTTTTTTTTTAAPVQSDLTISLSGTPSSFIPGTPVTLEIEVREINGADADGSTDTIFFTVSIPHGMAFTSAPVIPSGWSLFQDSVTQWTLHTNSVFPANGSVGFTLMASSGGLNFGEMFNYTTSINGGGETNFSNNTASDSGTTIVP